MRFRREDLKSNSFEAKEENKINQHLSIMDSREDVSVQNKKSLKTKNDFSFTILKNNNRTIYCTKL